MDYTSIITSAIFTTTTSTIYLNKVSLLEWFGDCKEAMKTDTAKTQEKELQKVSLVFGVISSFGKPYKCLP